MQATNQESASTAVQQQQIQRHSMYETSSSSQSTSMHSMTFQQQNTIPIVHNAHHLQPLGGRADVTAQPDQDDPCSPTSVSSPKTHFIA